jgi:hypothetical protein
MYASKSGTKFYKAVWGALIDADKSLKELEIVVNDLRMLRGMPRVSYQYVNNMIRGEKKPSKELLDAIEILCGVKITAEEN